MEGIDVVYWINLPSAVERRAHMEKILSDEMFEDIPKIRRIATTHTNIKKRFTIPKTSYKKAITDKEYACLFSHLNTIREFSNSPYETALILEDDITLELKPYWTPMHKVLQDAPNDWEILKLNSYITHKKTDPLYIKLTFPCYDNLPKQCTWSTSAYVIKKSAAKKLMRMWNGKKYNLPKNTYYVADYLIYEKLVTYDYKYQYFIVRFNNDSLIQTTSNDYTKTMNTNRKKVMSLNKTRRK